MSSSYAEIPTKKTLGIRSFIPYITCYTGYKPPSWINNTEDGNSHDDFTSTVSNIDIELELVNILPVVKGTRDIFTHYNISYLGSNCTSGDSIGGNKNIKQPRIIIAHSTAANALLSALNSMTLEQLDEYLSNLKAIVLIAANTDRDISPKLTDKLVEHGIKIFHEYNPRDRVLKICAKGFSDIFHLAWPFLHGLIVSGVPTLNKIFYPQGLKPIINKRLLNAGLLYNILSKAGHNDMLYDTDNFEKIIQMVMKELEPKNN